MRTEDLPSQAELEKLALDIYKVRAVSHEIDRLMSLQGNSLLELEHFINQCISLRKGEKK